LVLLLVFEFVCNVSDDYINVSTLYQMSNV